MSGISLEGPRIAALDGASTAAAQELMARFAARLAHSGFKVAGVLEHVGDPVRRCETMDLREIDGPRRFTISQDLGPGSEACRLDVEGLSRACGCVQEAIRQRPDLVVLSKFGKMEAHGRGLADAFADALFAGIPVLTSVPPVMRAEWRVFAGPFAIELAATLDELEAWWFDTIR